MPSKFDLENLLLTWLFHNLFPLTIRTQSTGEMSLTRLLNEHQSKQAALRRDNGTLGRMRHRRHLSIEDKFYSDDWHGSYFIHPNLQRIQERLRKEAVQSAGHFTDALAETLSNRYKRINAYYWSNISHSGQISVPELTKSWPRFMLCFHRVSQIFVNQKDLEQEAKNLSLQSARYAKQTTQWLALVSQFDSALKVRNEVLFSSLDCIMHLKALMTATNYKPLPLGTWRCPELGTGHREGHGASDKGPGGV